MQGGSRNCSLGCRSAPKRLRCEKLPVGTRPEMCLRSFTGNPTNTQRSLPRLKRTKHRLPARQNQIKPARTSICRRSAKAPFRKLGLMAAQFLPIVCRRGFLQKLDAFDLMMIEQPRRWDDMYRPFKLQPSENSYLPGRMLTVRTTAEAALSMGACD